eukprot:COSAG05_NODE_9388_length_627_cov_1.223485_1_plen_165_part_01
MALTTVLRREWRRVLSMQIRAREMSSSDIPVSRASVGSGTHEQVLPYEGSPPGALNKYSAVITQQKKQGAGQSQLYGTGMTQDDMQKPQIGIMSNWFEGNPCNMHLDDLQRRVWEGVEKVGMKGMRYTAIGVSDGISNGTDGMSYSLQSRDLIADSMETVMGAQF